MTQLLLGLIGDNIRASRAPALHRYAGELAGLDVSYDLFIPPAMGKSFDEVFAELQAGGIAGVNVTLPYKERVVPKVRVADPSIARIGAVNTVRFGADGAQGFNTDYSGFQAAYRAAFGPTPPGRVVMIGAGGVGKAVAFGLVGLGAAEIIFVEKDMSKAVELAKAVTAAGAGRTKGRVDTLAALKGADGVINCTPLGMVGYPGSPVPDGAFRRAPGPSTRSTRRSTRRSGLRRWPPVRGSSPAGSSFSTRGWMPSRSSPAITSMPRRRRSCATACWRWTRSGRERPRPSRLGPEAQAGVDGEELREGGETAVGARILGLVQRAAGKVARAGEAPDLHPGRAAGADFGEAVLDDERGLGPRAKGCRGVQEEVGRGLAPRHHRGGKKPRLDQVPEPGDLKRALGALRARGGGHAEGRFDPREHLGHPGHDAELVLEGGEEALAAGRLELGRPGRARSRGGSAASPHRIAAAEEVAGDEVEIECGRRAGRARPPASVR